MYLKRLEIFGFKTFAERTRLDFTKGLTAIVGPNGAGKSNIADAVRWVLGEQSPKNIRGGKMEDVIFSGTKARRALNLAEVSLLLDNSDDAAEVPFAEIKITRRMYRSGESEYLINGAHCRLKDVRDVFTDTGLGKEGYSIIAQGKIDEVLGASGKDRRLLFDEAAGIVKYRNKKAEAESELETERRHLERLNDIMAEIASQIEPLREQSEKAKDFLRATERLKLVRINVFLLKCADSNEKTASLNGRIAALTDELKNVETAFEGAGRELARSEREQASHIAEMGKIKDRVTELLLDAEKKEGRGRLFSEKAAQTEREINNAKSAIEKKQNDFNSKTAVSDGYTRHKNNLLAQLAEKMRILSDNEGDYNALSAQIASAESDYQAVSGRVYGHINAVSALEREIETLESGYAALEKAKEKSLKRAAETSDALANLEKTARALQAELGRLEKALADKKNVADFIEAELAALSADENEKTKTLNSRLNELSQKKTRLRLLTEMEASFEGYAKSVKAILAHKRKTGRFENIHGVAGRLITARDDYQTAISIALGGFAQNLVTDTEYDAKDAIVFLRENRCGRATFLPISTVTPKPFQSYEKIKTMNGFIDIAENLVDYDEKYKKIFAYILGQTAVVDTIDNALAIFKRFNHAIKIVTLSGELLSPGGAITGGESGAGAGNIFSRNAEILRLGEDVARLTGLAEKAHAQAEEAARLRLDAESQKMETREAITRLNLDFSLLQKQAQNDAETIAAKIAEKTALQNEDAEISNGIIETNRGIRAKNAELTREKSELKNAQTALVEFQNALSAGKIHRDEKIRLLTELKIEITGINGNIKNIDENLRRMSEEADDFQAEIEKTEQSIKNRENRLAEFLKSAELLQKEANALREAACETEKLQTANSVKLRDIDENSAYLKERLAALTNERLKIENDITRLSVRAEQMERDIKTLYGAMWDEYEITYNRAKQYAFENPVVADLTREETQLKEKVREMGAVNIGAIEEYAQKSERLSFLTNQREDILNAEGSIKKLIADLEAKMEETFLERLGVISENFNAVFADMFGGGEASVTLSGGDNALEAGIELSARPPGKNRTALSLLSGGERALTALSLLFAILKLKPSPFCVLDETDAALDEINSERFINYLKNFSHDTQFILITHKKNTMAGAAALYGITMQEVGVSKLVSVKLVDF